MARECRHQAAAALAADLSVEQWGGVQLALGPASPFPGPESSNLPPRLDPALRVASLFGLVGGKEQ